MLVVLAVWDLRGTVGHRGLVAGVYVPEPGGRDEDAEKDAEKDASGA
ncbi:MAG: hypothetical protein H0X57_12140, partial [Rubrobacter sp.]|nr:hypothetical protein [Rubrobacter sp.]